jgi:hypothetical protein
VNAGLANFIALTKGEEATLVSSQLSCQHVLSFSAAPFVLSVVKGLQHFACLRSHRVVAFGPSLCSSQPHHDGYLFQLRYVKIASPFGSVLAIIN